MLSVYLTSRSRFRHHTFSSRRPSFTKVLSVEDVLKAKLNHKVLQLYFHPKGKDPDSIPQRARHLLRGDSTKSAAPSKGSVDFSEHSIPSASLKLTQRVMSGGTGEIHRGVLSVPHEERGTIQVAVTVYHRRVDFENFHDVLPVLCQVKHPNLPRVFGFVEVHDSNLGLTVADRVGRTANRLSRKSKKLVQPHIPHGSRRTSTASAGKRYGGVTGWYCPAVACLCVGLLAMCVFFAGS
jgi:G3E family GTPase